MHQASSLCLKHSVCCAVVFLPSLSSGIYTLVKLLGRKSDFWRKAEPAGQVNVKHNICTDLWPNPTKFLIQGPFAPCPAGSGLGNAARDPLVVPEPLRSSWENLFPRNSPGFGNTLQTVTLAGLFGIREGFCKGIAAEISCVRARWLRHCHTLVIFQGELGKIYGKLGKCWVIREEKCPMARAGEGSSELAELQPNSALSASVVPEFVLCWGCRGCRKQQVWGCTAKWD